MVFADIRPSASPLLFSPLLCLNQSITQKNYLISLIFINARCYRNLLNPGVSEKSDGPLVVIPPNPSTIRALHAYTTVLRTKSHRESRLVCFTIKDFRPHIAGNDHPRIYCMLCLLFGVRYSSRSLLNDWSFYAVDVVSFWSARAKASSRILVPVPDHIYFVDKGHRWQCAGKQLALMIKCYNISHVILRTTREDTPAFELLTNLTRSNHSILLLKSSPKYFNRILSHSLCMRLLTQLQLFLFRHTDVKINFFCVFKYRDVFWSQGTVGGKRGF